MDGKKVYKSMYEWLNMWAEQYGSHEALCDNKGSYSYESLNTSVKLIYRVCRYGIAKKRQSNSAVG